MVPPGPLHGLPQGRDHLRCTLSPSNGRFYTYLIIVPLVPPSLWGRERRVGAEKGRSLACVSKGSGSGGGPGGTGGTIPPNKCRNTTGRDLARGRGGRSQWSPPSPMAPPSSGSRSPAGQARGFGGLAGERKKRRPASAVLGCPSRFSSYLLFINPSPFPLSSSPPHFDTSPRALALANRHCCRGPPVFS